MEKSIVVVGSCIVDFACYTHRLPKPGETVNGTDFRRTTGGKGANQCVAAAKLGAKASLVGSLGADAFGNEFLDALKAFKVDTKHVKLQNNVSTGCAQITVAENGENCIIVVTGANAKVCAKDVDEAQETIKNAAVLLTEFEIPLDAVARALKVHKGHGIAIVNGAPAVANLNPEIMKDCHIFCVNETEAEIMTGIQGINLKNAQEAVDILLDKGCNTIIITLGAAGSVFASKEQRKLTHVPVETVKPVDTTGAGDAFLGSLAYFFAHHPDLPLKEKITRASKVATQSVLKPGTQVSFPTREECPKELFL